jgi:hypothetical protein
MSVIKDLVILNKKNLIIFGSCYLQMFNGNKGNFFIFLVIILIVSVTPVSAELMHETDGNTINKIHHSAEVDENIALDNTVEIEMNEIEGYTDSMNQDSDYAKNRAKDYNWKYWKWPSITADIINTLHHLLNTAQKMEGHAIKLKVDVNKLKAITTSIDSSKVNKGDICNKDACYMADELSTCLNTKVTVEKVTANQIKKGDIVQYFSQEKYPRYLTLVDVKEDSNVTKKANNTKIPIQDSPSPTIPTLFLKGTGTEMTVLNTNEYIELNCNPVDMANMLQNTALIQQADINANKVDADSLRISAKRHKKGSNGCFYAAFALGGIGLIIVTSAAATLIGIPLAIFIGVPLAVIIAILGVSGCVLYEISEYYNEKADKLYAQIYSNQMDLDNFTKNGTQKHDTMNVTTFDSTPVVKRPPMSDWKDYQFILLEDPKHGTVLPGPGLQFLYGSNEGYTGEDTFTFGYIKNDKLIGNVTVNTNIGALPIFTIPRGG